MLKANYGRAFPRGALDPAETIHEELDCDIKVQYLSGVYYHKAYNSQAFIFRCELEAASAIRLSEEHTEFSYVELSEMSKVQKKRVSDCLNYTGITFSGKF